MEDQTLAVSSPTLPVHSPASTTFTEDLKNLDFTSMIEKVKGYHFDWTEIGIACSIGILSGFLFKRYLKSFLALVVCGVILLALLEHYGIIMLDWSRVHTLTGVEPTQEAALNFLQHCWLWIQVNTVPSIACAIGFLIGVHLG